MRQLFAAISDKIKTADLTDLSSASSFTYDMDNSCTIELIALELQSGAEQTWKWMDRRTDEIQCRVITYNLTAGTVAKQSLYPLNISA